MSIQACERHGVAARWKSRFQRSHRRLQSVLKRLRQAEMDWAPDDGIESPREHLWEIAVSRRWLAVRLARGRIMPAQETFRPEQVDAQEIVRLLDLCHRNLGDWLDGASDEDILSTPASVDGEKSLRGLNVEDLLYHQLELEAHRTAAIDGLSRLIDPARVPVL
ncbi:MAG TPA: DinB family protein [Planctomycetes bacterium]|nr:DinB family protein [Planctomycetota bacterium]